VAAPESFELLLLNNAQNLRLQFDRQFADFVEKERAAIGRLKAAHFGRNRPRKRATLIAEQFALQQCRGNGRAIDRDTPVLPAGAGLVNRLRDEFLTSSCFPLNEDGAVRGCDGFDILKDGHELAA
jgi:hypothetical protein